MLLALIAPPASAAPPAGDVALSVNVAAARKPISNDIYGLHEADEAGNTAV